MLPGRLHRGGHTPCRCSEGTEGLCAASASVVLRAGPWESFCCCTGWWRPAGLHVSGIRHPWCRVHGRQLASAARANLCPRLQSDQLWRCAEGLIEEGRYLRGLNPPITFPPGKVVSRPAAIGDCLLAAFFQAALMNLEAGAVPAAALMDKLVELATIQASGDDLAEMEWYARQRRELHTQAVNWLHWRFNPGIPKSAAQKSFHDDRARPLLEHLEGTGHVFNKSNVRPVGLAATPTAPVRRGGLHVNTRSGMFARVALESRPGACAECNAAAEVAHEVCCV